jgi:hypothetical protein
VVELYALINLFIYSFVGSSGYRPDVRTEAELRCVLQTHTQRSCDNCLTLAYMRPPTRNSLSFLAPRSMGSDCASNGSGSVVGSCHRSWRLIDSTGNGNMQHRCWLSCTVGHARSIMELCCCPVAVCLYTMPCRGPLSCIARIFLCGFPLSA